MEFCNGNEYSLKTEVTIPPSYLKEFFLDENEIILVYEKDNGCHEDIILPVKLEENSNNSSANELTGDPLKVDLEGDDSFGSCGKSERPNFWTSKESTYFPLTLKRARHYINQENKIKKCEGEEQKAIYVVCDGKDNLRTVFLGAQKNNNIIVTTTINIIGCYPKDHVSLEKMEMDHIKNTRIANPKVEFLVRFKYYLYGTFIQNVKDLSHAEHHGNISVEVTCNKSVFSLPQNPTNMKMVLKIIAGHKLSSVHFLWEELCLLQTYLDILSDSDKCNDELTNISREPVEESDICTSINNVISSNLLKREAKMNFDLKNIRQEHILDKLWNILQCCENLSVLRDSLHYLFEELVDAESNIKIPENDKSNIGAIINGLLNGKIAIPTLTFSQALECLFELGAEKLKNDYQTIIKHFYSASDQAISMKWSKFQNEDLTSHVGHRKTRITVCLKTGVIDLSSDISKLAYLGKLHVATELTFLIKDHANLPEETFDYFCERVYKNYVDKDSAPYDFIDLQTSPLCEFAITLNSADTNIIEEKTPDIWAMQMTSKVRNTEIITTYHLSEYPIFPPSINNSYDLSEVTGENNSMIYYVSKLTKHKDVF